MTALLIASATVRADGEGRYCLQDLHSAAGGHRRHQPSNWLRAKQTKELVAEIEAEGNSSETRSLAVVTVEGRSGGTFVCDDLVIAYANWISPKFYLRVIRAFKSQLGVDYREASKLFRQRIALETKDQTSKVRASFGSHLMLDRRRELPSINDERAKLKEQMELRLFTFEQERAAA